MRVSILLWLLMITALVPAHAEAIVEDGVIDLRDKPLTEAGIVELRGNWAFYWQAFLEPTDFNQHERLWIQTPATWERQEHVRVSNHGYGTYHVSVLLAEEDVGQTLGLHIPGIASAYDIYINGEKLLSNGQVGTSQAEMKASAVPQTVYYTAHHNKLDLTMHVSNFVQRKGGIWAKIELGTAQPILQNHDQRIAFEAAIALGLFIMGIFHIALYFFLSAKTTLYFGLASLLFSFRMLFVGEVLAIRFLPEISWEIAVKIEYMSVFLGMSFFLLYFYHLYRGTILRPRPTYALFWFIIVTSLPILAFPAKVYTEWMLPYQIIQLIVVLYIVYGLIIAVIRRMDVAWINLTAGIIFLLCVLIDILNLKYSQHDAEITGTLSPARL